VNKLKTATPKPSPQRKKYLFKKLSSKYVNDKQACKSSNPMAVEGIKGVSMIVPGRASAILDRPITPVDRIQRGEDGSLVSDGMNFQRAINMARTELASSPAKQQQAKSLYQLMQDYYGPEAGKKAEQQNSAEAMALKEKANKESQEKNEGLDKDKDKANGQADASGKPKENGAPAKKPEKPKDLSDFVLKLHPEYNPINRSMELQMGVVFDPLGGLETGKAAKEG
jgi:hypothetical protein